MKALVVYESAWGNTKAVAEAVAEGLSTQLETEVLVVQDVPPPAELQVDLPAAAFDTHVRHPNLPGRASRAAAKKLRKLGCRLVADPESFYVDGYGGPLLPGELDRARAWGAELGGRL